MTLKAKVITALILFALASIATATTFALYYRGNAIGYKAKRDKAASHLKLANDTITNMQARQRDVAALDAKYTKELVSAQATIDQLQRDVAAGKRRLQLSATCAKQSTSGAAGMDDAASPRLTDSAERDYFTLRERINVVGKQIAGLQEYVIKVCLK